MQSVSHNKKIEKLKLAEPKKLNAKHKKSNKLLGLDKRERETERGRERDTKFQAWAKHHISPHHLLKSRAKEDRDRGGGSSKIEVFDGEGEWEAFIGDGDWEASENWGYVDGEESGLRNR